ncbi:MAG: LacI family DNA-binding transcriptional regulator [Bacteroidota bacterium]
MKPTLKQISELTGYSISTVSRSLANSSSISKKTRDEVHRAASGIGYRPRSRKKRSRKRKKTLHFALLSEFRIGEFYASMFCGYRDAAYREGIRLSLLSVQDQRSECVRFIQQIHRENQYDGYILFFPALERAHYEEILKVLPKGFPVISNALIDNPNIATITFDGYTGGRLAAEHFHQLGYRRLGIIEGPVVRPESRFRSNGFIDYIRHHPELELTWRFHGDYEFQSGLDAFNAFHKKAQLLQNDHNATGAKEASRGEGAFVEWPADAIFAANDSMATGFMEAAREKGIPLPGQIAVLGYDNLPIGFNRTPPLSSVDTDFIELGVSSIKALKNKISKQGYKHGTLSLIPVRLIGRESTAG